MRFTLSFFTVVGLTAAHTTFTNFFINGQPQGDGVCVRMSLTPQNATSPLPNITAPEMACGVDGNMGVARVCPAPAGSVMTFEFREWPDASHPGSIDSSHKGPIAVYMKQVADPTANGTATGNGWFKIFDADFDNSTQKWATETLIANNGHLSVTLPTDVPQGYYLVRTELLALHEASATPPDPQFYVGCAQIFLQSNGTTNPLSQVTIPGYIDMTTNNAAMTFNIYKTPLALPYPMFGPPVYTQGPTNDDVQAVKGEQTIGLKPDGCVLETANWCGVEIASYSDEAGCWNASQNCWAQGKECYAQAPPTGGANCKIWENKCNTIDDACNSNNFNGPPNQGQILTPPFASNVSLPAPANGKTLCANCGNAASTTAQPSASAAAASTVAAQQANTSGGDDDCSTSTGTSTSFITSTVTLPATSPAAAVGSGNDQTTTLYSTSTSTATVTVPAATSSPAAASSRPRP
jgi:hypothetical protein